MFHDDTSTILLIKTVARSVTLFGVDELSFYAIPEWRNQDMEPFKVFGKKLVAPHSNDSNCVREESDGFVVIAGPISFGIAVAIVSSDHPIMAELRRALMAAGTSFALNMPVNRPLRSKCCQAFRVLKQRFAGGILGGGFDPEMFPMLAATSFKGVGNLAVGTAWRPVGIQPKGSATSNDALSRASTSTNEVKVIGVAASTRSSRRAGAASSTTSGTVALPTPTTRGARAAAKEAKQRLLGADKDVSPILPKGNNAAKKRPRLDTSSSDDSVPLPIFPSKSSTPDLVRSTTPDPTFKFKTGKKPVAKPPRSANKSDSTKKSADAKPMPTLAKSNPTAVYAFSPLY